MRPSFGFHGQDGFYIGPALEHYRCVHCYIPMTRRVVVEDTVQFFPNKIKFPTITINDRLIMAIEEIVSILNDAKFRQSNATLNFQNESKIALQLVTDI